MTAEPPEFTSCDICGRTILKGETVYWYLNQHGDRALVCALCRHQAERAGWVPADQAERSSDGSAGRRRGQAIRDRLERVAARRPRLRVEREPALEEPRAGSPSQAAGKAPPPRRRPSEPPTAAPSPRAQPRRAVPRSPDGVRRRAVQRFNESPEARTVAGLYRSLGEPQVAVHPAADALDRALVTVAWELSWYQWEVGVSGEAQAVNEVAKGSEVSELAEEARAWNARAASDGSLHLRRGQRARDAAGA